MPFSSTRVRSMVPWTLPSVPLLSAVRNCGAGAGEATAGGATGGASAAGGSVFTSGGFVSALASAEGRDAGGREGGRAGPDAGDAGMSATGSTTGSALIGISCGGGAGITSAGRSPDLADADAHAPAIGARPRSNSAAIFCVIRPSSRLPVFSSSRLPVFPSSRLPVFPSSRLLFFPSSSLRLREHQPEPCACPWRGLDFDLAVVQLDDPVDHRQAD